MRILPVLLILVLAVSCRSPVATPPATDNSRQKLTNGAADQILDFFLDPVGKLYFLRGDSYLVTDNPLGGNAFVFYDGSLGRPSSVDVSNPFAILVYYADYGRVVILDRTLSERARLNLFAVEELAQPGALARGNPDGIWVFDDWNYQLKFLNDDGTVRRTSNDLRLDIQLPHPPEALYVEGQRILLHFIPERRLAVFTNYGRFVRWVDLPAGTDFGWASPFLTARTTEGIWRYRAGDPAVQTLTNVDIYGTDDGARPRVQSGFARKILWTKEAAYQIDEQARIQKILPR